MASLSQALKGYEKLGKLIMLTKEQISAKEAIREAIKEDEKPEK